MKLVFIISGLYTGGAETMLLKLIQGLNRSRFKPEIISLSSKGDMRPQFEALGVPVLTLGMRPGLINPFKFLKLIAYLRKTNPDLVHTWMSHANLLGGLAARLAGIRSIAWCIRQSNISSKQNNRRTLMVIKACAFLSKWVPRYILTCSNRAKIVHAAVGYDANKMVLIPNGFDLARFQPDSAARESVRKELNLPCEAPLVGMIGRYNVQKNHLGFIKAAALVHQKLPQTHFLLAGRGIDKNNSVLRESIKKAHLQNHMHMLGERNDIPRLMASLDILASSSSGEAFPNVLGEAMACEVPCVVTDVGDSAEIVGNTGRVVSPKDMEALAKHLIELLEMPARQRANLGTRERVRERYEINNIIKQYEDFYLQLGEKS